ncbi:MAG: hypothetical protein RLZZ536_945, partial [Planctomycetota bacterium]
MGSECVGWICRTSQVIICGGGWCRQVGGVDEAKIGSGIMVRAYRDQLSIGWLVVRAGLAWLMVVADLSIAGQDPDPEAARSGLRTVV